MNSENNTKPRLIVHIGGAKCGSSSIQAFLRMYADDLREQGIIIPDVDMSSGGRNLGAQLEYFELCRDDMDGARVRLREQLLALVEAEVDNGRVAEDTCIIISAENLSCWNGFARLFEGLDDVFDIAIVIYIRRQDEYLISFWQQWYLKINDDFWAWVLWSLGKTGDWAYTIEPWAALAGDDRVIVRRFSRKSFINNNLVRDFAAVAGIKVGDRKTEFSSNPSYNDAVVDIASQIRQDVFEGMHDNRFYQMMADYAGESAQKKLPSGIMTCMQRQALIDYYAESNAGVKARFLGDDDEPLFEPLGDREKQLDKSNNLSSKIALAFRLLFKIYLERRPRGGRGA